MEPRKDLTHSNVYDLRKPPEAYRRKNPDFSIAEQSPDLFAAVQQLQTQQKEPDYWEQNSAYTKWMEKRESYNVATDVANIRKVQENSFVDAEDPEIALHELRTIGLRERLQSLQQIMRPYNGR